MPPFSTDPQVRIWAAINECRGRLSNLESKQVRLREQTTAPDPSFGNDGEMISDSGNDRIWLKQSGTWRYVPVT
jgi:hypothetical protein